MTKNLNERICEGIEQIRCFRKEEGTRLYIKYMRKEILYSLKAPYRDDLRVTGYRFGFGEKTACIVGALRGNEVQQLYIC